MRAKTTNNVLRDMMTFAKRFTANDLLQEGIISAALPYDELIEGANY